MIIWLFKVVCLFIPWSFRTSYFNPPQKIFCRYVFGHGGNRISGLWGSVYYWFPVELRLLAVVVAPLSARKRLPDTPAGPARQNEKEAKNAFRIHSCTTHNFSELRWNRKIRSYLFESDYLFSLDKDLFDGAVLFLEMLKRGNYIVFMSASIRLF